jgi:RNA polymerase sigma factor (sigma-70 family)
MRAWFNGMNRAGRARYILNAKDMDERDVLLLERVAGKDRVAFQELYQRYYHRLFGFIFKLTRRPEVVEEALNDTLLAVWKGAGSFDGRSRVSTWILGIAHRQALKALSRTKRAERDNDVDADAFHHGEEPEGPESLLARRELASVLGRALAQLPPEQRAVVELTYYQGCSYPEIAAIVGCPVNTVKTRMFHARRRLRGLLAGSGLTEGRT